MSNLTLQWEYEDQLPEDITSVQYAMMFPLSKVDVVRMFPFVEIEGVRHYLAIDDRVELLELLRN